MNAYRDLFDSIADEAAFFWALRGVVVNQPDYFLEDINAFDQRLVSTFNALMTDLEESWDLCIAALDILQAGETFAAANIAFRSLDIRKIQQVVEIGLTSEETFEGLVGALAWLPGRLVHSWIKKFLTSKDLNHKYLAIAACSFRREDPREYLTSILSREDCRQHTKLYARSIRLVGELKRQDLKFAVDEALKSENQDVLFWSIWSSILLGNLNSALHLKSFVFEDGAYQAEALDIAFRSLAVIEARDWISEMVKLPGQMRRAIKATATLGDPQAIPWLIAQARVPELARLAGEAFATITGINLVENKLALEDLPVLDEMMPEPEAANDEGLDVHEDAQLPFPDADKIAAVWQRYQNRYVTGKRYFMGQQISAEHLNKIYAIGSQRHRRSAALELALLIPGYFLQNYAAKSVVEE